MFYQNETIHHPDSKRNLSVSSWVGHNTVVMPSHYDPSVVTFSDIDIRKHNEIVAQGFLYVRKRSSSYYDFVYKLPAGIYTQQGLRSGSIDIPSPECYLYGLLHIAESGNGVKAHLEQAYIQSEYIAFLPMTNTYAYNYSEDVHGQIDLPRNRFSGISRICQGRDVLGTMIGEQPDIQSVFNAMSTAIIGFLFGHGNTDLSLVSNNRDSCWDANRIAGRLDDVFDDYYYNLYWFFLNYLSQTMSPADIFDKLRTFGDGRSTGGSVDTLLTYFGIAKDEFRTFMAEYQKTDRKLTA